MEAYGAFTIGYIMINDYISPISFCIYIGDLLL